MTNSQPMIETMGDVPVTLRACARVRQVRHEDH